MAAAQPQVSGGQLSSINPYSGNPGLEGLAFIEAVDRAKDQFTWTEMQTTQAAISRGGNAVANWIRGEKAEGIMYNNWNAIPADGIVNLRPAPLTTFGPKYTTGGAVAAIADLKQRHSETAASFMDRVKIAVVMLHYNVREEDQNAAYREII